MTPLAYQIGNALLPVCLSETAKMRVLYEKDTLPKLTPQCEKLRKLLDGFAEVSANKGLALVLKNILAEILLTTNVELSLQLSKLRLSHELTAIKPMYNNFTVVVVEKDTNGHKLYLNVPRIVTHGKNGESLRFDGEQNQSFNYTGIDTRLATDEEIEACVNSLSAKQIKQIMTMDLFAPIVNPLFEEQTELVQVEEPELEKPKPMTFEDTAFNPVKEDDISFGEDDKF